MRYIKEYNNYQSYEEIPDREFYVVFDENGQINSDILEEFTEDELTHISDLISQNQEASKVVEMMDDNCEDGFVELFQRERSKRINYDISIVTIVIYRLKDEWFLVCVVDYRDIHNTTMKDPLPKPYIRFFKCDQIFGLSNLLKVELNRFKPF